MAHLYSIKPQTTELHGLIRSIWCYQGNSEHQYEQVLPGLHAQLLVNVHENNLRHWKQPGTILRKIGPVGIQGILTEPVLIDTRQKTHVCGVEFTSVGLSAFCNANATQFTNTIVDASDVWGLSAAHLRSAVVNAASPAEQCQIIQTFLVNQKTLDENGIEMTKEILSLMRAGLTITEIRSNLEISQRRLHKLFKERIGILPKTFQRLSRFGSALEPLSKRVAKTAIAHDLRYADHAHFTREFRTFSGITPTDYLPIANENHHLRLDTDILFKTVSAD